MASRQDHASANILGERGLRYKRNVLAISLIVTVLAWTNAPLGEVSLFGVSLPEHTNSESISWTVVAAILVYQFTMLTYYGWTDFVIWNLNVKHLFKLSVSKIYLGNIKEEDFDTLTEQGKTFIVRDVTKDDYGVYWRGRSTEHPQNVTEYSGASLLNDERTSIRRRLNAFMFLEFGTPFLWGLGSLIVATYRTWN